MKQRLLVPALLALLAADTVAARADDAAAALHGKITAAMSSAKSFVTTTSASTGFTVTMTFAAPDRYHSSLSYIGTTRDVVIIGPAVYVSNGGQPYRQVEAPPDVISAPAQLREVPVDRVLPDMIESGVRWGRFETTSSGPQKDQHLVCTYDKRTYRLAQCSNEGFKIVFSRYDDPQNVVTMPSNLVAPASH